MTVVWRLPTPYERPEAIRRRAKSPPTRPNDLLEIDVFAFENYCAEVRKAARWSKWPPPHV